MIKPILFLISTLLTGCFPIASSVMLGYQAEKNYELKLELCEQKAELARIKGETEAVGEIVCNECIVNTPEIIAKVKESCKQRVKGPEDDLPGSEGIYEGKKSSY